MTLTSFPNHTNRLSISTRSNRIPFSWVSCLRRKRQSYVFSQPLNSRLSPAYSESSFLAVELAVITGIVRMEEDDSLADLADTPFPRWVSEGVSSARSRRGRSSMLPSPPPGDNSQSLVLIAKPEKKEEYELSEAASGQVASDIQVEGDNAGPATSRQSNIFIKVVNRIGFSHHYQQQQQQQQLPLPPALISPGRARRENYNDENRRDSLLHIVREISLMAYKITKALIYLAILVILLLVIVRYMHGGNGGRGGPTEERQLSSAGYYPADDRQQYYHQRAVSYAKYSNDLRAAHAVADLLVGRGHFHHTSHAALRDILDELPTADDLADALAAIAEYMDGVDKYENYFSNENIWALQDARRKLDLLQSSLPPHVCKPTSPSSQFVKKRSSGSQEQISKRDKKTRNGKLGRLLENASIWTSYDSLDDWVRSMLASGMNWAYDQTLGRAWWTLWSRRQTLDQLRQLEQFLLSHQHNLKIKWKNTPDRLQKIQLSQGYGQCQNIHHIRPILSTHKDKSDLNMCFEVNSDHVINDRDVHYDGSKGRVTTTTWISSIGVDQDLLSAKNAAAVATTVCREITRWGDNQGHANIEREVLRRERAFEMRRDAFKDLLDIVNRLQSECSQ
ncbi:hypothetical protein F4779DRAFT_334253 [Xylariaceae sp. FL0662B]|nr:hypothetical protein F4779DRAFT_334253 [Xylariaceae sp. FL0662B]